MTVSVIICTYNGEERLPETLASLAKQQAKGIKWEVLVINNACNDNTDDVVHNTWDALGHPAPLRLLHMPTQGKSNALQLGVFQSLGELIIICDDDNWLMPDYVSLAISIMEAHPEYGIVGGRAEAVADQPLPEWFYEMQYAFACGCPQSVSMDFTGIGMLWGAGMVIRRKVGLAIMSAQCPTRLSGRKGDLLTAGEDDEKCVRTWLMGYKTYFDYRLQLSHYMPAGRLTPAYAERLKSGFIDQGPYIGAYRRLFQYRYKFQVSYHWAYRFFAWLFSFISGNKTTRKISTEYLYLATGWNIWHNDYIANAEKFWNFISKNGYFYKANI